MRFDVRLGNVIQGQKVQSSKIQLQVFAMTSSPNNIVLGKMIPDNPWSEFPRETTTIGFLLWTLIGIYIQEFIIHLSGIAETPLILRKIQYFQNI